MIELRQLRRWVVAVTVGVCACAPVSGPTAQKRRRQAEPEPARDRESQADPDPASDPRLQASASVRAHEVLAHADDWLGDELVVDIYEPVVSAVYSSAAPPGGYEVEVADVGTDILNLVPDGQTMKHLPAELVAPFRVRGTLQRDDDREQRSGRTWRRIEVHAIAPLRFPEPVPVPSAAAVTKRPRRWHGRYVELEGDWMSAFEASYIDRIWISLYPDVEIVCEPPPPPEAPPGAHYVHRVRLVGYLYTRGRYGHMGGAEAELVATKATFLGTPGCDPDTESGESSDAAHHR